MAVERLLRFSVLMPVRDDWSSAAELIRRLERTFSFEACTTEIIMVDDASLQRCARNEFQIGSSCVRAIRTLRLRRNLGHQRGIAANMLLQRQSMPTTVQLQFWDRCMVPVSRVLDRLFLYSLGKTIIAVWRRL